MLDEGALDELTLNELARRVGLAKSNVYRYYESREAILLQIFHEDICEWVDELVGKLGRIRAGSRIDKLASLLASTIAARPRLCLLNSVVAAVLEHNITVETARRGKLDNMVQVRRLVDAMAQAVPELTREQHDELLQLFNAFVVGFWADANPSDEVSQALEDPALKLFRHPFEASLKRGALLLATGLVAEG